MGRKELVLINLAPTSSPCLLTGLVLASSAHLVLHLLLVLLHLLLLLLSAATRHEHMHDTWASGWICLKERELVSEKRSQGRYIIITYLGGELPSLLLSLWPLSSYLGLACRSVSLILRAT